VNGMLDVNKLLDDAIRETDNLDEGEIFLAKVLFKGYVLEKQYPQGLFNFFCRNIFP
jgi:hypothetical protein